MSPRSTNARAKAALNRGDLVVRALSLADDHGLDAVTIRRLAEEFGVTPMAMYWHFAAKDDLLDAMGDRIIDDLALPSTSLDLGAFLTAALRSVVDALRRHPASAMLAPARIMRCEHGRDLTERTLAALADAGYEVADAAAVAHNAMRTAVMLVSTEPGREDGLTPAERDEVIRGKRTTLEALPVDRYPHLVAAADAFTACADPDTYYASSIDAFVAGVLAQAPARRLHSWGSSAKN